MAQSISISFSLSSSSSSSFSSSCTFWRCVVRREMELLIAPHKREEEELFFFLTMGATKTPVANQETFSFASSSSSFLCPRRRWVYWYYLLTTYKHFFCEQDVAKLRRSLNLCSYCRDILKTGTGRLSASFSTQQVLGWALKLHKILYTKVSESIFLHVSLSAFA